MIPRLLILDRDGLINHASSKPDNPFYYILNPSHLVLMPNVLSAFNILEVLRREMGLMVVLATKQRCVSKGLLSEADLNSIHRKLENLINFQFNGIYIETEEKLKTSLYKKILLDAGVYPSETLAIDDSEDQCDAARALGIPAIHTTDLYYSVTKTFL